MAVSIADLRKQTFKLEEQAKELDEKNRSFIPSLFLYIEQMLGELGQWLEKAKQGRPGAVDEARAKAKALEDFLIKNEEKMKNPQLKLVLDYFRKRVGVILGVLKRF